MDEGELMVKVYQLLPLIDCGECGAATCEEFAKKIIDGEMTVFDCTRMSDEQYQKIALVLDEFMH